MAADDDYEGEGDFALYLYLEEATDEYERLVRSQSMDELRAMGERLLAAGRYKAASIYRWNYDDQDDTDLIEELTP